MPCSPYLARCLCGAAPLTPRVTRRPFPILHCKAHNACRLFSTHIHFPLHFTSHCNLLILPGHPCLREGGKHNLTHPELGETKWEYLGLPAGSVVKNPPANTRDTRNAGWIPGLERPSEGGNGNPLQYACLENFMGREAWWTIVHMVAKSWTQLSTITK